MPQTVAAREGPMTERPSAYAEAGVEDRKSVV